MAAQSKCAAAAILRPSVSVSVWVAFLLQSAGCAMAYCIPAFRGCQCHADAGLLRYICMAFEHCHSFKLDEGS